MGIAEAVLILANLTSASLSLLQQAGVVSDLIKRANEEGRSTFTPEEWALITGADDAARNTLDAAIKAKGG